ncbi:MAG: outer membrane protein assembly factor BamD [Rikenellaceae bacterium]
MNQRALNIFFTLLTGVLLGACATQNKLSAEDPEVVYKQGLVLYEAEKWNKASRHFENIMGEYIGAPCEDSIIFFNARCKFKDTDYNAASTYFEAYRRQFSRSPFLEDAEGMLILCYYYSSPPPDRDPTNVHKTISSIDEFMSRYPKSDKIDDFKEIRAELVQRLHDRSYLNAYTYYKIGKYKSAIVAFKNSLKEYPESTNREKIMYYMILSGYELARNSIESLQVDRYLSLVDMYYTFIAEFPSSEWRKDVDAINEKAKAFLEKSNTQQQEEDGKIII